MGLLDWLNPTRDWPVVDGPAPELNRTLLQFDSLRFGSPLESAAHVFGRPDEFKSVSRAKKEYRLTYLQKGVRLRFREDKLDQITFLIKEGSKPVVSDGTRLSSQTGKDQVVATFGKPDPDGSEDFCLQIFHGQGVISDFYFEDPAHSHLTEWTLYPDD
jgi:hypothetical protein